MGTEALTFFMALLAIMNPVGNVGVFLGMVGERPQSETLRIAWTCALASAITGLIVMWSGTLLLKLFGVGVDALRVAGGLIVLLIGLAMLCNDNRHRHTAPERAHGRRKIRQRLSRSPSRSLAARGRWRQFWWPPIMIPALPAGWC